MDAISQILSLSETDRMLSLLVSDIRSSAIKKHNYDKALLHIRATVTVKDGILITIQPNIICAVDLVYRHKTVMLRFIRKYFSYCVISDDEKSLILVALITHIQELLNTEGE